MKRDFNEFVKFIKNKKTAVVGMGISNRPLIHFLSKLGAEITAFDRKTKEELGDEVINEFSSENVKFELGENYLSALKGFDVVFKTPSMRIDSEALVKAKQEGAYITSEMEEFIKYCPAKIFGVTGSDGKTTTTTLIYNMLKEEGYKTWVGGNIGTPLFSKIKEVSTKDKVVLELSSFQLMTIDVSPEVAVVTNLSPNHLDIHKNMEEYINAKKNIFTHQSKGNVLIINRDNEITNNMESEALGDLLKFSRNEKVKNGAYYNKQDGNIYLFENKICNKDDIKIKGMDNVKNFMAAFCAVSKDVSKESMIKVAMNFAGVEHRREFVRELDGVKYYNDSIASSPTRTISGLNAYERPVILIAGGYDKHIPFEPLAEKGYDKIKVLILMGATKNKIKETFDKVICEKNIKLPIILSDNLEEAVCEAKKVATNGDIVTLSPACASFDSFPNFEVRGNKFKEIVNNLK
ncbi:UDP-N-acetylmuramoyl-L-alanine--D-glutamate ligase [Clostridium acetobutylicum]|uniref:UDP-N-acetylmuramoylalanine--D-glutamate ligase n=1 Tax=Clostridium acetobutylicum (strain ATCC 824 / DSM 792 / JCM 1419 / IAM 19013 / LMG 5710 / NBRC 13948 / NRRL B-527 / VKM B-1787 / 2291 / W) TaxID=272562 RepID=MURD_CLOAB|nr:UDP-N-acetylmuramoyl-L-alanine--D-glutamate ligase [Clostridium acetobutylicum]Q97EB9.1 RecName: Full=UDP-N-acetylmuramoylalanine--D-glutamate ligase; AltName: Full=D-glutamic acid-adding enzyme; AltName: Full=UDP-N-acetylmuramoyl-L-alanyl-D-glutamate synthetase [Clostridium acetobutylicum ATCC 824]AAK81131.1 UDP-N-acetylmuramoylalanine D-glutamate ligase [Clostridium acetobutylicum ATCC 824]